MGPRSNTRHDGFRRDDLHAGDLRELDRELPAATIEAGDRDADGIVGRP
jgi:hypothetical protein